MIVSFYFILVIVILQNHVHNTFIGLEIRFQESDYIIEEDEILYTDIRLLYRYNQNPFTIVLSSVTIYIAEQLGLGFFITSDHIQDSYRAHYGELTLHASLDALILLAFQNEH